MVKKLHLASLLLVFTFLCGLSFTSCKQACNTALQTIADDYTKTECPAVLDEGMKITSASVDSKAFVYHIEVDENINEVAYDSVDTQENIDAIIETLNELKNDKDTKTLFALCREAKLGIAYEYNGSITGKSARVTVPYDKIPQ